MLNLKLGFCPSNRADRQDGSRLLAFPLGNSGRLCESNCATGQWVDIVAVKGKRRSTLLDCPAIEREARLNVARLLLDLAGRLKTSPVCAGDTQLDPVPRDAP